MALSILTAATVGSVVVYQRGERKRALNGGGSAPRALRAAPVAAPKAEPTLSSLSTGDVVSDGIIDWLVVGTVAYREEDDRWALHRVQGDTMRWLEVRRVRGRVEAVFVDETNALPKQGTLLDGMVVAGARVSLEQRGDARVEVSGDCGGRIGGLLRYVRYSNAEGNVVLVDDAETRHGYVGQRSVSGSLEVYSGELNRDRGDGLT
jgi:Domain of unknown function (DUF4178)